jgi:hypothetical protein
MMYYRISAIFTVGAGKRVYLPDKALYQRLGLMMGFVVIVLAAWTVGKPPVIQKIKTSDDLLFYICNYGPMEYAVISGKN